MTLAQLLQALWMVREVLCSDLGSTLARDASRSCANTPWFRRAPLALVTGGASEMWGLRSLLCKVGPERLDAAMAILCHGDAQRALRWARGERPRDWQGRWDAAPRDPYPYPAAPRPRRAPRPAAPPPPAPSADLVRALTTAQMGFSRDQATRAASWIAREGHGARPFDQQMVIAMQFIVGGPQAAARAAGNARSPLNGWSRAQWA